MASSAKQQQQQQQQPAPTSPLTPTSYRRQSRNTTETSAYGLLENEGGEGAAVRLEHVRNGEEKGKDKTVMYQDGGEETGGDLGGEELVSEGERERRRRAKGKGRAVESAVEEDNDEVQDGERHEFALDAEEEEAREEQRIAQVSRAALLGARRVADLPSAAVQNLARMSKAETARRKSIRKSSTLVLPPAPPLPPLPSASNLARRSSALIRAGSKRMSRAMPNRDEQELEALPTEEQESRRSRRRGSLRLEERPPPPLATEHLEHLVEGDERSTLSSGSQGALTPPAHPTANPFTSPPASPLRTTSFDARHQSRFLEDLPLQSPGSSPTKPTSMHAGLSRPSLESPLPSPSPSSGSRNPFADGFAMQSSGGGARASRSTLASQETVRPAPSSGSVGRSSGVEQEERGSWEEEEEDEEEEVDDTSPGLLGWLFCGCWRSGEGEEQAGRTNPNE